MSNEYERLKHQKEEILQREREALERPLLAEIDNLRLQLKAYSGWSPHQFTGLLKEHRELQEKYKELHAERDKLAAENAELRKERHLLGDIIERDVRLWDEAGHCEMCHDNEMLCPMHNAQEQRLVSEKKAFLREHGEAL
jgi:hypothetical protein